MSIYGRSNLVWTHAETYKGSGVYKFIHKTRLKKIVKILKKLKFKKNGSWADFGCSDGFIFSYLREKSDVFNHWKLYGFDHDDRLLDLANKRDIFNSSFVKFDINEIDISYESLFDMVTCFETIEHAGNYKNAFENIYLSCKINGFILLSVPNEMGLPGIIKFIGKKLLRKNVYKSFFKNFSEFEYFMALIKGKDIENFRNQESNGWRFHLGFNYKNFEKYFFDRYVNNGKCSLIKKDNSFFGFNIIYVLKKCK